ncbi:MAG: ATP-binding cassette domain-containing protein [Clostridia bacterium]|nr:ATP-binding cassette domain-containing protein [Clostridia bacterium]
MAFLEVENLSFGYPETKNKTLYDINFTVSEGEFCLLCGASGCGKTTLLKLLKKQLSPYGTKSGKIIYNGTETEALDEKTSASEIGFIMQNPESQIVTDTVWHELSFGLENLGVPSDTIHRRVAEIVSFFGIGDWFHKKTAELSGGQKQQLNLAAVLVMQPKILLLDEPTAQLDPIASADFLHTLQKLNQELGLTVLIAEHNLEDILSVADKVLMLENGNLQFAGSPRDFAGYFKQNPDHPIASALPAATRIYSMLQSGNTCPLNVKEGRSFICRNYGHKTDSISTKEYQHHDEKAVELKKVWFRYEKDSPDILKGTNLTVFQGEHFCILGGNGTGKTTTVGIMAGLFKPYSGKVFVGGKRIEKYAGNSLYFQNIAVLTQNPQVLFLHKTVLEDLTESAAVFYDSSDEGRAKIAQISKMLDIENLLECHPYDLSGGEQQKCALAKVLIGAPKIVLLDEPTKALDADGKRVIAEIIKALKATGITVITVTHDIEFVAENADRCGLFFDGDMISVDTPTEFFDRNTFYTTAANRIARGYYQKAVTCEDVVMLCKQNSKDGAGK